MQPIISFLSPDSTEQRQAASIDAAFSALKAAGLDNVVNEFHPKIVAAIQNQNLDEFDALGGRLMDLASKNMSIPADQRKQEKAQEKAQEELVPQDQLVSTLNMLLGIADENNIDLPNAQLKQLAQLAETGSPRLGKEVAKLEGSLNELLKISRDESKDLVTLQDGTQVLRGAKTGTYYQGGSPISRGALNAEVFNEMAFAPTREVASAIPTIGQIAEKMQAPQIVDAVTQGRPGIYSIPEVVDVNKKEAAIKQARALYEAGDLRQATDILNSVDMAGMFPGPLSPDDARAYFDAGAESEMEQAEAKTVPSRKNGETIADYRKRIAQPK